MAYIIIDYLQYLKNSLNLCEAVLNLYIRSIALLLFTSLLSFSSAAIDGVEELPAPDVNAQLAIGFNYDYLKSPLNKDFERAKGYFGINIPLTFKMSESMMNSVTEGVSDNFTNGTIFSPDIAVKQFLNTTIQVDVPMLWGVASFGHMRMMNIDYKNSLGLPTFLYTPDLMEGDESSDTQVDMLMRGAVSAPVRMNMSWESMNLGYSYKFGDKLTASFNLYRHYFHFNVAGNIDIDILGKLNVNGAGVNDQITLDYSLHNSVDGFYELVKWRPTMALKYWRLSAIARLGFDTNASGALDGGYSVPFFIDASTFEVADMDQDYIIDNYEKFKNNETTTVEFNTETSLHFSMPHAFSASFDIVPSKLFVSYTKLSGPVEMALVDDDFGNSGNSGVDSLDFRVGATVDHIMLLAGNFPHLNFTLGAFQFNASYADETKLLSDNRVLVNFGEGVLLPIASLGFAMGDKFQVMFEVNITPFTAVKSGVVYHF